ncbi:peptidyl-prolyl cis-trans isomerase [Gluconacetobacter sp. Hr-1-5]|uniref:peptidylprolyl isomerase n=1 Tax=Gluconacetobacter sp. Hr-1-5 TaxID=3395370 RepID=UPI003B523A94
MGTQTTAGWWDRVRGGVPFLIFILIGGSFFLLYWLVDGRRETISVSRTVQTSLFDDYAALSGHVPDAAEKARVIENYVTDEVLFREAVRRHLYLTDGGIRQRLIEQMRFMLASLPPDPTEDQMMAYYAGHARLYRTEPEISLRHVFFQTMPADPAGILAALNKGEDVKGDDFGMGLDLPHYGESMISGMFGLDFLHAVQTAPMGVWIGPVRSSRGVHFVRVEARVPSERVPYDRVRDEIRQDLVSEQSDGLVAKEVAGLKRQYDIAVDR